MDGGGDFCLSVFIILKKSYIDFSVLLLLWFNICRLVAQLVACSVRAIILSAESF